MKDLIKILTWIFFVSFGFILQSNRFLSVRGINPNLIILIIFLGVILEKDFSRFLISILITIALSLIFWPYWLKEILILSALGLAAFPLKKFLTGNDFSDLLILVFSANLAFYSLINFHYILSNPMAIIAELFYNMVLGILTIFVIKIFFHEKKTRIKP